MQEAVELQKTPLVQRLGGAALFRVREIVNVVSVLATVISLAIRPRFWPRTVRNVLARQVLFTGVEAAGLMAIIAVITGASLVVQAQVWLTRVGQGGLLGPLLVTLVIRELGPLLANLLVIIRSASAMASEMGNMKLSGEVRVLDAQGIDPLVYLVMPRVVGMAACVFCLTIVFVVVSLTSGYLCGALIGVKAQPGDFLNDVLAAIGPADVINLLTKSLIPAAVTATICCSEGLGVVATTTEIPQATTRGLARSVIAMFFVSGVVSLLTYL